MNANLTEVVTALTKRLDPWEGSDPLPRIEELLGITPSSNPDLPPPNEIGEEDPDVKVRSAHQYRLARARDAGAGKFRYQTRHAYGGRCAICGGVFGGVPREPSGVDAATSWRGARMTSMSFPTGYASASCITGPLTQRSSFPSRRRHPHNCLHGMARGMDDHSRNLLGTHNAAVPIEYLPSDRRLWPSPKYLETSTPTWLSLWRVDRCAPSSLRRVGRQSFHRSTGLPGTETALPHAW